MIGVHTAINQQGTTELNYIKKKIGNLFKHWRYAQLNFLKNGYCILQRFYPVLGSHSQPCPIP